MKLRALLSICLFLAVIVVTAQPNNPSNPVPLDGGMGLLIAAGAALGYKTYRNSRK